MREGLLHYYWVKADRLLNRYLVCSRKGHLFPKGSKVCWRCYVQIREVM